MILLVIVVTELILMVMLFIQLHVVSKAGKFSDIACSIASCFVVGIFVPTYNAVTKFFCILVLGDPVITPHCITLAWFLKEHSSMHLILDRFRCCRFRECGKKSTPWVFLLIFRKRVGILTRNFTHLFSWSIYVYVQTKFD